MDEALLKLQALGFFKLNTMVIILEGRESAVKGLKEEIELWRMEVSYFQDQRTLHVKTDQKGYKKLKQLMESWSVREVVRL